MTETACEETYTRDEVIEFMAMALRWGYESRVDEENEAWPDTEIVFNAGATIRALDRKRYREACDAAVRAELAEVRKLQTMFEVAG